MGDYIQSASDVFEFTLSLNAVQQWEYSTLEFSSRTTLHTEWHLFSPLTNNFRSLKNIPSKEKAHVENLSLRDSGDLSALFLLPTKCVFIKVFINRFREFIYFSVATNFWVRGCCLKKICSFFSLHIGTGLNEVHLTRVLYVLIYPPPGGALPVSGCKTVGGNQTSIPGKEIETEASKITFSGNKNIFVRCENWIRNSLL